MPHTDHIVPTGCSGGGRGELHHPLLCADGLGGVPHPHRDPGDLLLGGPVSQQGSRQEAQTGCVWTSILHDTGLSHQGLLSGRHTGRTQGEVSHLEGTHIHEFWLSCHLIYPNFHAQTLGV